MNAFERQKAIFNEFCEDVQDRFDLIIRDGVNIIFQESSLTFDQKIMVRYTLNSVVPELLLLDSLKSRQEIEMLRNIMNNYDEICEYLKRYVMIFNQIQNFKDQGSSDDEVYVAACKNIQMMVDNKEINGQKFFIKTFEKKNVDIYLLVENFGSTQKKMADLCYEVVDPENGTTHINHYQVKKEDFVTDVANQIATQKCTHLE